MARASQTRRGGAPARSYGITGWGAAFLRGFVPASGPNVKPADSRRISKARSYFRDRHVHALAVGPGRITSSVTGSQLDPFAVTIELRTVDAETVAGLLRRADRLADLTEAARGGQPSGLLEFVAPTDSGDVTIACTCPVDDVCIHVLATAFEVAAMIDREPGVLLSVMGAPLGDLLAVANAAPLPDAGDGGPEPAAPVIDDFYGDHTAYPPPPTLTDFHVFTEFEAPLLRRALRATGIAALDVAEATDELADLYDRITGRR